MFSSGTAAVAEGLPRIKPAATKNLKFAFPLQFNIPQFYRRKRVKQYENGKDSTMWLFMTCTTHKTLFDDQINKNEMGGACALYGGMREA
jgi:hypothetical protein